MSDGKNKKNIRASNYAEENFDSEYLSGNTGFSAERRTSKKNRAHHGRNYEFSDLPATVILMTVSVIVLVAAIAFAIFYQQKYMQKVRDDIYSNLEASNSSESNEEVTENDESDDEFMTVEESDFDKEIEIPPSSIKDNKGNYLVEVLKNSDGSIVGAVYNTYDGEKIKLEKRYNEKSLLSSITEYIKNGKRLYEVVLDAGGNFNGYSISEYNVDSVLTKKSVFAYGGTLSEYFIYGYGESGTLERVDNYSSDDILISYVIYEYDGYGNNTARLSYDSNDKLEYRVNCTYDEYNRLTREETVVRNVCKSYTEYFYAENGEAEVHSYYLVDEYEMIYKEA